MNKYYNGKIYKITDINYSKCYIGSTCESLSQRMAQHRRNYRHHFNNPEKTMTSFKLFEEYGIENCKIELLENYPCQNKEELLQREGYYIQSCDCLNRCVAGRSPKEYKKEYNPKNQEKIKECLKQWYEKNSEKQKQKAKEYREQNKDTISEKCKETVQCCCGAVITKYKLKRHETSKKHQYFINNQ